MVCRKNGYQVFDKLPNNLALVKTYLNYPGKFWVFWETSYQMTWRQIPARKGFCPQLGWLRFADWAYTSSFCCRCPISNLCLVLDSSPKTTGVVIFDFFVKSIFCDFGSRIDRCPIISSFSDYSCYVRKPSSCQWVLRFLKIISYSTVEQPTQCGKRAKKVQQPIFRGLETLHTKQYTHLSREGGGG